ncbi:MAG: CPBP family intramembrane metalloprotease [Armatimonadetes bacterium]|nr:CPBP family intramembrane metalloprotease [Armatimonadota bacterium]
MSNEPTPSPSSEVQASFRLLFDSLKGGAGIVSVCAILMLLVVWFHPDFAYRVKLVQYQWWQFGWIGLNLICLLLIPVLVIRFGLREKVTDYGLTLGDWRLWGKHAAVYLAIVLPVIAIASRTVAFREFYPMFALARERPILLIPWELAYGAYFLSWEFFFRGFLLRGLAKQFGPAAIAIQTVPFVMMHFRKPEAEVWGSVIAGLALGVTAYRSRSTVGCWIVHWICAAAMDILALA